MQKTILLALHRVYAFIVGLRLAVKWFLTKVDLSVKHIQASLFAILLSICNYRLYQTIDFSFFKKNKR